MKKQDNVIKRRNYKHINDIKGSPKLTRIYLVSNCYNDPNKVYVGKEKSHQIDGREYSHKKTFGKKANFEYIDRVEGWNKKRWRPLEKFWIKHFKDCGYELMNGNDGGSGPSFHTQEAKDKMSISLKGKRLGCNQTQETKDKISKALKGRKKDEITIKNMSKPRIKLDKFKFSNLEKKNKKILQYDLNGVFIKEWKSLQEAEIFLNVNNNTNISACCLNKQKTAWGYIWRFKVGDEIINKIEGNKSGFKILQYDLKDNFLKEWNTVREIKDNTKYSFTTIYECLRGKYKQANGFKWKYKK